MAVNPDQPSAQVIDDSHKCQSPEECAEFYDAWSPSYEEFIEKEQYRGAELLAEVCLSHLNSLLHKDSIEILDIGVGSGKVGQLLMDAVKEKYGSEACMKIHMDGLDGSEGMLRLAREKQIYRQLYQEILLIDKPSQFLKSASYDIVMGVGLFSPGHMSADHIVHFLEPAKKGGLIEIGIRETWLSELHVDKKFDELEKAGKWRLVERICKPGYRQRVPGIFFAFERL